MPKPEAFTMPPTWKLPIAPALRFTVQRAGSQGHYLPGWFVVNAWTDDAAWLPTFADAIDAAQRLAAMRATELRRETLAADLLAWGMAIR